MFDQQSSKPQSPPVRLTSRRSILRLGAVGMGVGIVAACGGKSVTPSATSTSTASSGSAPTASPFATATVGGSPTTFTANASAKTLAAATAFLATLDTTQRAAASVDRTQANLSQWSNLPDGAYKRAGLRMDTLSADQQAAALEIMAAVLSPEGYTQVSQVTAADGVLATTTTGSNPGFGADRYWIRFVGSPSAVSPWTIQYGGHHLAVNVTIVGANMTMAPTLWGSQPALYTLGGSSYEPFGGETAKAFALMTALDGTQQNAAILSSATRDLVLGAGQDGKTLTSAGVKASTFTSAQKQSLLNLVQEWLRPLNAESVASRMASADSELNDTLFAWSGASTPGSAIYYRVHSPSAVMEFAHQGQGGDAVNHIHSIYREIGNDYGAKLTA